MEVLYLKKSYVLITPARNEEVHIERIINAVISQTILPKKWLIISDGSIDRTDQIVDRYAAQYKFIRLLRLANTGPRDFRRRVYALNTAYEQLRHLQFDFVGVLDADISFSSKYYENLFIKFMENPRLGIAGGIMLEKYRGSFKERFGNSLTLVAGAIQLFRRECYEDIGGYTPHKHGGADTLAILSARMHGWQVKSFPELKVLHYRRSGTGGTKIWGARFHEGILEYLLGFHPVFHLAKCFRRVVERPYFVGSLLKFSGYSWSFLRRQKRTAPKDVINYLRQEQMRRLKSQFLLMAKALRVGKN